MTGGSAGSDVQTQLRAAIALGGVGGLSDGQLLRRYLGTPDEVAHSAFDALVARHGPMVLRVCRQAVGNSHDAQDAFQATFLVLARRAESVRDGESLASWLHGVALRVGGRARADAARRRVSERRSAESQATRPRPEAGPIDTWDDLHAEIARLPTRYREPVILCYLEGLSVESAALKIGCPRGTVLSRLSRARKRLREGLTRRGLAPPAVLVAGVSQPGPALPPALVAATTRAALRFMERHAAGAAVASAAATTLAKGTLKAMLISKLKVLAVIAGSGLLALGGAQALGFHLDEAEVAGSPSRGDRVAGPAAEPRPADPPPGELARLALEDAKGIENPAERAEALLRLGTRMGERGLTQPGLDMLRLALDAAGAIPPNANYVIPHPAMRVAQAMARAGHRDEARRAFREALRMVLEEDEHHQGQSWVNLPRIQLEAVGRDDAAGLVEAYRQYLSGGRVRPNRPPVVVELLAQAMSGDIGGAFHAVQDRPEFQGPDRSDQRRLALMAIVSQIIPGDEEAAGPVLAAAEEAVHAPREGMTGSLSQDLEGLVKTETRLGWFDRAVATARSMEDELPAGESHDDHVRFNQAQAFVGIARGQAQAKDRAGACASARLAIAVVAKIRQENMKPFPLEQASILLAQNGDIAGAMDEANRLNQTRPVKSLEVLLAIEEQQRKAGDIEGTRTTLAQELEWAEANLREVRTRGPQGQPPDPEFDRLMRATAEVARIKARLGDPAAASRDVDSLPPGDLRDEALALLALDQAMLGAEATARATLGRIESPRIRRNARIRAAFRGPVVPAVVSPHE